MKSIMADTDDTDLKARRDRAYERYTAAKTKFNENRTRFNHFDMAYWLGHYHGLQIARDHMKDDD